MDVEFVRFKASDGVELQGWYSGPEGDTAVVHIHGMSGNGYENYFLDEMRDQYASDGIALFTFDNRGRGIISEFRAGGSADAWGEGTKKGGSCFEIFDESAYDIQGAVDFLESKGKKKIILQGHSLGGSKVVSYLLKNLGSKVIFGAILLAPTDMVAWAATDPKNDEYIKKAHELLKAGKPEQLVGAQCWLDHTPLSAQTYPSICEPNTSVDIYADPENGNSMHNVKVPMLIIYGDKDIGIEKADGNIGNWKTRTEKVINDITKIHIAGGASHSFKDHEHELAKTAVNFIRESVK